MKIYINNVFKSKKTKEFYKEKSKESDKEKNSICLTWHRGNVAAGIACNKLTILQGGI